MTALSVYKEVLAAISVGIPDPSVTSNDLTELNVLSFIGRAGKDIAKKAEWPNLIKGVTIGRQNADTIPGQSRYALPADFNSFATGSPVRDTATSERFEVIVNMSTWLTIGSRAAAADDTKYMFMAGGHIYTNYTSPNIDLFYVSKNWLTSGGSGQTAIQADADVFLIPEELIRDGAIWRWNREKGLEYQSLQEEFDENLQVFYSDAKGGS